MFSSKHSDDGGLIDLVQNQGSGTMLDRITAFHLNSRKQAFNQFISEYLCHDIDQALIADFDFF